MVQNLGWHGQSGWIWLWALMTHCSSAGVAQILPLVTHKFWSVTFTMAGAATMPAAGKGWQALLPMLDWLLMLCGQFRS